MERQKPDRIADDPPEKDLARLEPDLELVPMPHGWTVCDPCGRVSYVFFASTSIV